jgi:uncharacterized membrane protein
LENPVKPLLGLQIYGKERIRRAVGFWENLYLLRTLTPKNHLVMMNQLPTAGKWLYALPMVVFGLMHFGAADQMAGMVPSYLPMAVGWVYLTGIALVLAGAAVLAGRYAKLALQLLGLMLVLFAAMLHLPTLMAGGEGAQMAMPMLLKDLALGGAAWWASATAAE